jgi:hypothetical protein
VVSNEELSEMLTTVPPVGAAFETVTVHVAVPLAPKLVGEHVSEESESWATRLMVAVWETPLRVAVRVAL